MSHIQALVLGLVQGLTEFLPISSSGHLVLIPDLLGWDQPSTSFDLILHAGTLVAVVTYFRKDLWAILMAFLRPGRGATALRRLALLIAIGSVPAVFAGALLENTFESFFRSPSEVAGFLLITGILLVVTGTMVEAAELAGRRRKGIDEFSVKDSLFVGILQAAAIAPGISRSGSTIAAGLFLGYDRETAARFSFLLSIPIIAGAALFKLRHGLDTTGASVSVLVLGFIAAALSGFAAITFLLGYIRRHSIKIFAYYCWALGVAVIIWHLVR